jgi:hypothetical protein
MSYEKGQVHCGLDYFSFSVDGIDNDLRDLVTANIQNIANQISDLSGSPFKQVLYQKGGYGLTMRLPLFTHIEHSGGNHEVPHLFIQALPKTEGRSFFKCDVKGHPLTEEQWACSRLWGEEIFGKENYKVLFPTFDIAALDVATDINATLEHFLFDHARSQEGCVFFDKKGNIKTMYIGSKKSKYRICIYCRKTKREKLRKPTFGCFPTRMEMRLKLANKSFSSLLDSIEIDKKLLKFTVYDVEQMKDSDILEPFFIEACLALGIQPMLQRLSKNDRRAVRKELKRFEIVVVDTTLLTSLLEDNIRSLAVMDPEDKCAKGIYKKAKNKFKTKYL